MSRCAAIEEELLAFSHELLEGREHRKVAEHLEGCAACRARSEVLQAELAILGEEHPAPEQLWAAIAAELDQAPMGFLDGAAGEAVGFLDGQAARASASVDEVRALLDRLSAKEPAPRVRARVARPRRGLALAGVLVLILATTLGLSLFQPPERAPMPAEVVAGFRRGIFLAESAAITELVSAPEQGGPR